LLPTARLVGSAASRSWGSLAAQSGGAENPSGCCRVGEPRERCCPDLLASSRIKTAPTPMAQYRRSPVEPPEAHEKLGAGWAPVTVRFGRGLAKSTVWYPLPFGLAPRRASRPSHRL
jgi:hypothetical protein